MYFLKRQQIIDKPLDEVFNFFAKPENLAKITPPSLGFKMLSPSPVTMKEGALIDYTIRLWVIPVRWTTLITLFDPPHKFIDQQIRGPYSFWHHTHTFSKVGSGTSINDEVQYLLPLGILGNIAHGLWVKRQLKRIFAYRAQILSTYFNVDEARG